MFSALLWAWGRAFVPIAPIPWERCLRKFCHHCGRMPEVVLRVQDSHCWFLETEFENVCIFCEFCSVPNCPAAKTASICHCKVSFFFTAAVMFLDLYVGWNWRSFLKHPYKHIWHTGLKWLADLLPLWPLTCRVALLTKLFSYLKGCRMIVKNRSSCLSM